MAIADLLLFCTGFIGSEKVGGINSSWAKIQMQKLQILQTHLSYVFNTQHTIGI